MKPSDKLTNQDKEREAASSETWEGYLWSLSVWRKFIVRTMLFL